MVKLLMWMRLLPSQGSGRAIVLFERGRIKCNLGPDEKYIRGAVPVADDYVLFLLLLCLVTVWFVIPHDFCFLSVFIPSCGGLRRSLPRVVEVLTKGLHIVCYILPLFKGYSN